MEAPEPEVDADGVVRIGSVVFALIRATPGHELAFHRWYAWDHFFTAGTAAPGVFSAGLFVQPESGWHLALYFVLPGHDDGRIAFATEQVARAAGDDRLFTEREHLHTWSYAVEAAIPGADGVPAALALDRRYPAVSVTLGRGGGAPTPASAGPSLRLRPTARIMAATWDADVDPAHHRTLVEFHPTVPEADPVTVAESDVHVGLGWSGVFRAVVFGTDTYITD